MSSIPQDFVKLLFDQLKESDRQNQEALKDLTSAITQLINILGNNPADTIQLLKELKQTQDKIDNRFSKLFWIMGITITIIGLVMSFIKVLEWYWKLKGGS